MTSSPTDSDLYTIRFWRITLARIVRGAATAVATILTGQTIGAVPSVPWHLLASSAATGAVMSLAASLSTLAINDDTQPRIARLIGGTGTNGANQ